MHLLIIQKTVMKQSSIEILLNLHNALEKIELRLELARIKTSQNIVEHIL